MEGMQTPKSIPAKGISTTDGVVEESQQKGRHPSDGDTMEPSTPENCGDAFGANLCQSNHQNWVLEAEEIKRRQRQEISDLQEALEKADEENIQLLRENTGLKANNKSLQQVSSRAAGLVEELESGKQHLTEKSDAIQALELQNKDLEKKKAQLEQQVEDLSTQIFECSEDNMVLQEETVRLKSLVQELEEKLQKSKLEMKEHEELFRKKECYMEEMSITINEYSSIIEVLHNRIRWLTDQLEKGQQELALLKMAEEAAERSATPPASGSLMYEIVQAELEKKLMKTHFDKERRQNRLFGLRLLLFMLWRLIFYCHKFLLLTVFLVVWLAVSLFYLHLIDPSFLKQKFFSKSIWILLQQTVSPWLTLHSDGLMPV